MTLNANLPNAKTLGIYRYALSNAETHARISKALDDIGYGPEKLEEGKKLYEETRQAFHACVNGKDIKKHFSDDFADRKEELAEMFEGHRAKARLIYRRNPAKAKLLAVYGAIPIPLDKWIEAVRKYYTEALADQDIQDKLAEMKITQDELNAGLAKIEEVEVARAEYMKYKGDSQDFTQTKDQAFEKLHDWMRTFYYAAKIGLTDNPQLLEPLGKIVKR